jgi:AcrR family transcriptional regulator
MTAGTAPEQQSGRDRTLARLVAHVRTHGLPADPSLRYFAEQLGTSHRMLAYYFGSREQMLGTVLAAMRAEERETLWSTAQAWSLRDAALAMWAHYADPARRPEHQAFFYVFSRALERPAEYSDVLHSLSAWADVATELAMGEGDDRATAELRAQLIVSTIRGLLIDRLVSPAPERVDAAFEFFVESMLGGMRGRQAGRARSPR